ncbi:hypothetical protein ABW20_dc0104121 [Dactylellina cionopaga]|nr:hypothetical protein ABW20_dc0104121 [Dactylellina cionopaga]
MQVSRLSVITLLFATLSLAANAADPLVARDAVVAKAAGELERRTNLEERTPKSKKVKTGSSGGDEGDAEDDDNAASSLHLNIALVLSAGAVAISAMML